MEFPTNIAKYLRVNQEGFVICNGKTFHKQIQTNFINEGTKMFDSIINQLGANSAKAQGLKQIITNVIKFSGSDHRLYLKVQGNKAIGFLRTGQKKLFYHNNIGNMKQITPTCVLDIYVHESYQRTGIGKEIFQQFLKEENQRPQKLAYDRPSAKLIGFLKKHYGLSKYIAQNNNFVVFDRYFSFSPISPPMIEQTQQKQNLYQPQQFRPVSNRIYRYQKSPIEQMPLIQTIKQLNKTITHTPCSQKNYDSKLLMKKQENIEDSLSLLQKQMSRMQLKTPPVNLSGKQTISLLNLQKQRMQTIQSSTALKLDQVKLNAYNNYTPWATSNDLIFRTTSNTYGNYYKKNK